MENGIPWVLNGSVRVFIYLAFNRVFQQEPHLSESPLRLVKRLLKGVACLLCLAGSATAQGFAGLGTDASGFALPDRNHSY
ncbi:MAG: hypothetical protein AAGA05_07605, partial [Pseudomonadota bacterium]